MAKLLSGTRIYGTATVDTQLIINGGLATSSTGSGSLQVFGGAGISGSVFVGGVVTATTYYGTFAGTFAGSINTATNLAGGTAGQVPYQSAVGATSFFGPGTAGQLLVSAGTSAPTYTNTASIYVGAASSSVNLFGGTPGQLHYQSAVGTTQFISTATTGNFLQANYAGVPTWTTTASMYVNSAVNAQNLFGGTAGQLVYQSGAGATGFVGPGSYGQFLMSTGASAPVYQSTLTQVNGNIVITSNTAVSSTNSGALQVVNGGVGIGGGLFVGGIATVTNLTLNAANVALGLNAAAGATSVAVGNNANTGASAYSVNVGAGAGQTGQGQSAVSIGYQAGQTSQGTYAIAIGQYAGYVSQPGGSIILNASGAIQNGSNVGLYINPVRTDASVSATTYITFYNPTTKELTYNSAPSGLTAQYSTTATNLLGGTLGLIPYQTGSGLTGFIGTGTTGSILQMGANTATFVTTASIYVNASQYTVNHLGGTPGQLVYQSAANTTGFISTGTQGQILVSQPGAPVYTSTTTFLVGYANNLAGGTSGQLVYQTGPNTSSFTGPGTSGQLLVSSGASAPTYTNTASIYVGAASSSVNLFGGASGSLIYQSSPNATTSLAIGSYGSFLTSNGGSPVWTPSSSVTAGLATTATNIAGGTAGQVPYQTAPGLTSFFGPGTAGQLLVSAGTSAPAYTSTANIYVSAATSAVNLFGGATGSLVYQSSPNASAMLAIGTNGYVLTSNGAGPVWTAPSGLTAANATTATNIAGGTTGQVPYQSAPGTTLFYGPGTAGQLLVSAGAATPAYTSTANIYVSAATSAVNLFGGASGSLPYQSSAGATTSLAIGSFGSFLTSNGGAPVWTPSSSITAGLATTATNIAGGTAGQVPYQTAPGITSFVNTATTGNFLQANYVGVPTWTTTASMYVSRATLADTATTATNAAFAYAFNTATLVATAVTALTVTGVVSTATQVYTQAQPANAYYYPTFVPANNSSAVASSIYTTSSFTINAASGYVGYGTATPAAVLHANQTAGSSPTIQTSGMTSSNTQYDLLISRLTGGTAVQNGPNIAFTDGTATNNRLIQNGAGNLIFYSYATGAWTETLRVDSAGNLDLGYTSSQSGAKLSVNGGVFVNGVVTATTYYGTFAGTFAGSISTATNLAGGTAGQLHYQSAPGITAFAGPGTSGQILLSGGTSAPTYVNTTSIGVGFVSNLITAGTGLTGTAYNGSLAQTWTLNTATLMAQAVQVTNSLTAGTGLTGTAFNGSAPQTWTLNTATLMASAVNITGGATGSLLYQSAANATTSLALGTAGYVLTAGASAPQWTAISGLSAGSAAQVTTAPQTASGTYYPVFVSSNSAGNQAEYTTSSFTINPSSGAITIVGSGSLNFNQPAPINFANGQYIKDNGNGGFVMYSAAAFNINAAGTGATGGITMSPSATNYAAQSGALLSVNGSTYINGLFTATGVSYFGSNVGIGITAPTYPLQVTGTTYITNGFGTPNSETAYRLKFYDNGGTYNDTGIGVDGASGSEQIWFNALAGFYWNVGTAGVKMTLNNNGALAFGSSATAYGSSGQVLQSNGNAAPTWVNASGLGAGSVANALTIGTGLTGSPSSTYNGSAAITVSLNTATYMASAVLATSASKVTNAHSAGTGLTGTAFDGSAAQTWTLNTATLMNLSLNVAGGGAGSLIYQTGANATTSLAIGTSGYILTSSGSAPQWTAASSISNPTPQAVTFNNGGAGGASGTAFNGSVAQTISYNTIGASPLAGSTSLTTLGIVTAGTWNASTIGVSYGGTGLTTLAAGSIPYGAGTSAFSSVAIGTNGYVLTSNGSAPVWTAASGLSAGSTTASLTMNNSGSGAASGTTFNGSTAQTISYNTIGAPSTTGANASGTWGINISGNLTGSAPQLAVATESNSIYITAPSYTTDKPVKLLNFDWYGNLFSIGNIRSGSTPSNGFGFYYTASGGSITELARFTTAGALSFGTSGTAYGTSGQILQSNGNAAPTWVNGSSVTSGATTLANTQVGFGSASNLLTGSANLTWNGTVLAITGGLTSIGSSGAYIGDSSSKLWFGGSGGINYIESGNNAWSASANLAITGYNGATGGTCTVNFSTLAAGQITASVASGTTQGTIATFTNSTNAGYIAIAGAGTTSVVPTWSNGSQIIEFVPFSTGNGFISAYAGNLVLQTNGRTTALTITSAGGIAFGTSATAYGSSGQVLQSNGNAAPTWVSPSGLSAGSSTNAANVYQTTDPASTTYRIILGNGTNANAPVYNYSALYWNNATATIQGANISGSAAQLGGLTKSQLWNNGGQNHGTYNSFATPTDFGEWFIHQDTYTDGPSAINPGGANTGQYYSRSVGLGNDYAYGSYAMQQAIGRNASQPYHWVRSREAGTWQAWTKVAAGYADSAGSTSGNSATATVAGLLQTSFNRTDSTAYQVCWLANSGASGGYAATSQAYSCAAVTIQSSTGALNATTFNGAGTGLTGTAASLNIGGNAASAQTLYNAGGYGIYSTSLSSAYSSAVCVREYYNAGNTGTGMERAPRLGFHWGGIVASQIAIETSGRICIYNNPGTAYENFIANNIYASAEITAYASDKRLKTDIRPITNAIEKVKLLNGVIYKWNDLAGTHGFDQTKDMAGLLAQDVEAVLPEIIRPAPFDDDGLGNSKSGENYKTVQYEKAVPLLVEAIKEQQLMIESQNDKIARLESIVEQLLNKQGN